MLGYRLEVQAHVVTALTTSAQNLLKCAHGAGIEVSEFVLSSLASAEAVLTPTESEMGVMLVDIGGGTTDLPCSPMARCGIPKCWMWGRGTSPAIWRMVLRLPMETAEQFKVTYGHANPMDVPDDQIRWR